ncbi:MAG: hydroxymethylbilane synthase [Planctomycetota bacterium]|nr:MAG: hydroxymethylbilane synthase [Planctomycetota bacterium]
MTTRPLRLGTRASALARWQADWVAAALRAQGRQVELVPISTRGDTERSVAIGQLGSPGVFTKELQRALLEERIDLAVHSLKDLPTEPVEGLALCAVPERESPRDALVSRQGLALASLPAGAKVGTGSLRRRAQLLHARSDLDVQGVRGNVDTRLEKLAAGEYDALVLAHAGLKRLGREAAITELLSPEVMLPAVGQGALGIETRREDAATREALAPLDHEPTHAACRAERTLLFALNGGCLAPIGAWARPNDEGKLFLQAVVLSADGQQRLTADGVAALDEAVDLGQQVAKRLIADGALELIRQSRSSD